jgi:hypothetical protein
MNDQFTPQAQNFWDAIPPDIQERLLSNVWCAACRTSVTITDFTGKIEKGDLILRGTCATCGGDVARLIEGA